MDRVQATDLKPDDPVILDNETTGFVRGILDGGHVCQFQSDHGDVTWVHHSRLQKAFPLGSEMS